MSVARLPAGRRPVVDVPPPAARSPLAPVRVGLHLVLAALPLLTISAHVFGLVPMHVSAGLVVVPLLLTVGLLTLFAPAGVERLIGHGALWGAAATGVYDVVRLDTVYLLGWWDDFIPTMGTWILDTDPAAPGLGAGIVGYVWRYAGDGGGIGVTFFVLAAATGLHRRGTRPTVGAAVVFAVMPVWAGLIGTVALAPRGESLMFPLTPTTVALSLVGHLVFGLVLGLGCARCGDLGRLWPWPPWVDLGADRRGVVDDSAPRRPALHAVGAPRRTGPPDDPERTVVHPGRLRVHASGAPAAPVRPPAPPGPAGPAAAPPWWAAPPPAVAAGPGPRPVRPAASSSDGWGPPEWVTRGPGRAHSPPRATASRSSATRSPKAHPPVRAPH